MSGEDEMRLITMSRGIRFVLFEMSATRVAFPISIIAVARYWGFVQDT